LLLTDLSRPSQERFQHRSVSGPTTGETP
jgi:hypothetical protein